MEKIQQHKKRNLFKIRLSFLNFQFSSTFSYQPIWSSKKIRRMLSNSKPYVIIRKCGKSDFLKGMSIIFSLTISIISLYRIFFE